MRKFNEEIEHILIKVLHSFGVHHPHSSGFKCTSMAVMLVWEDQDRMLNLTHEIYEVIAATDQDLDASGVASVIHRVAEKAWDNNDKLPLAYDQSLLSPPTNSELLEILLQFLEDSNSE